MVPCPARSRRVRSSAASDGYKRQVQDQIMNRYVGGLGGPGTGGHDPHASKLRRKPTAFEQAEIRQADRSATFSLIGAFVAVTIGAIGMILVFALLATVAGLFL